MKHEFDLTLKKNNCHYYFWIPPKIVIKCGFKEGQEIIIVGHFYDDIYRTTIKQQNMNLYIELLGSFVRIEQLLPETYIRMIYTDRSYVYRVLGLLDKQHSPCLIFNHCIRLNY